MIFPSNLHIIRLHNANSAKPGYLTSQEPLLDNLLHPTTWKSESENEKSEHEKVKTRKVKVRMNTAKVKKEKTVSEKGENKLASSKLR